MFGQVRNGALMHKLSIILTGFAALGFAGTLAAAAQAPMPTPADSVLPAGPGRDATKRVCSACHSVEIVAQQHLSRAGWKEIVETMANNGAVASDAELVTITEYLSGAFPEAQDSTASKAPAPGK